MCVGRAGRGARARPGGRGDTVVLFSTRQRRILNFHRRRVIMSDSLTSSARRCARRASTRRRPRTLPPRRPGPGAASGASRDAHGEAARAASRVRARAEPRALPGGAPLQRAPPPSAQDRRGPAAAVFLTRTPRRASPFSAPRRTLTGVRNAYACAHADGTEYYVDSGATYSNPHERGVREALFRCVRARPRPVSSTTPTALPPRLLPPPPPRAHGRLGSSVRILDLSCGSGEATAALIDAGVRPDAIDAFDPYTRVAFDAGSTTTTRGRRLAPAATTPSTAVSSGDDSCVLVDTPWAVATRTSRSMLDRARREG